MKHHQTALKIKTTGKSLHKITDRVAQAVAKSSVDTGLCTVFIRHTSASLLIQENADPDVLIDLENFFSQLVPEDATRYVHGTEGLDDMPAHIRSVLTQTSEHIPVSGGRLVLGTWQGIYLWEHRQRSHQREIIVHVSGE
ncbi:MAG: secondary thiamine-phosphate synthase enzyme YjbQ [Pleurocapsa sp. MO_226.B13]|nr:secondary thiamine-phosphate synthase enzyme YjbQ [Pleurocapsa sp. MO_226.B13]